MESSDGTDNGKHKKKDSDSKTLKDFGILESETLPRQIVLGIFYDIRLKLEINICRPTSIRVITKKSRKVHCLLS